ncbi:MAG: biotin--[acetyl-CoA-carboxylase] ligase [Mycobacterium leprae]
MFDDAITPEVLTPLLQTRRLGRSVVYRPEVDSTNRLAKELARDGAADGLLVVADTQSAGRGRLGRSWQTPAGSAIAMSLVLRPNLPARAMPRITLTAAVAVAEAIEQVTGAAVGIKWPNDLQLGGRKLCGILTEGEPGNFAVLGIGLNVNVPAAAFGADVRETATSLLIELGRPVARAALVAGILRALECRLDQLLSGDFATLLDEWRRYSVTLGRPVRVLSADGSHRFDGVAEAVDEEGALVVRRADGILERVLAGEVSIRPAYGA